MESPNQLKPTTDVVNYNTIEYASFIFASADSCVSEAADAGNGYAR
jgi:hypothetical protein